MPWWHEINNKVNQFNSSLGLLVLVCSLVWVTSPGPRFFHSKSWSTKEKEIVTLITMREKDGDRYLASQDKTYG